MASGLGVGVLCLEVQKEFWRTIPGLNLVAVPSKVKAKAVMLDGSWQAALVWQPGFAADVVRMQRVPRVLGPPHPKLAKVLTHPLVRRSQALEHRVRHYLGVIEEMGVSTARPEFFGSVEIGVEPVKGTVLLCPDSDFGRACEWPLERWGEVARQLVAWGRRVTVAGLDGGRGLGKALAESLGSDTPFFEASPLAGTLPLLAVHETVLAADGSLPHLAAHVGSTCVTLFGPNDPVWRRPLGRRHTVVRHHVECAPCLLAKCAMDGRCQTRLETTRVLAELSGLPQLNNFRSKERN